MKKFFKTFFARVEARDSLFYFELTIVDNFHGSYDTAKQNTNRQLYYVFLYKTKTAGVSHIVAHLRLVLEKW